MNIKDLIKITNAQVLNLKDELSEIHISTDTRTIKQGDFYLPLKGASFDGENFIDKAIEKGAIGVFCTKDYFNPDITILKVENTLTSYLELAQSRRNDINPQVIAITGSSGKTTTKELIASVLSEQFTTFKTPLNHNNEIGLCQTIFEMPNNTQMLVLEMGMRGLGEIEILSKYSEPDITVISNVGTAHIGRLGTKENIAKAKCEIVKYQRGNLFIAHNDDLIKNTVEFSGDKIFYSVNDVKIITKSAHYSKFQYQGYTYELNVGGDYNIENSLSAINVGLSLGMSEYQIAEGLKKYHPIEKRWEAVKVGNLEFINDSYNANPDSMRVFINTILEFYKDYIIILGDMGELGENEIQYHKDLGKYINQHKLLEKKALIITVGSLAKNITNEIAECETLSFDNIDDVSCYIRNHVQSEKTIFLKASRSMKFENIINNLKIAKNLS